MMIREEEFKDRVANDGIDFVSMQFTDIVGVVKSVTVPVQELDVVLENGQWFDGSSVLGFARIAESDMYLVPDLDTYSVVPWTSNGSRTGRIICDVYTPKGRPFEGDPRYVLKKALHEASAMGFRFNAGPEPEFFLFESDDGGHAVPKPQDQGSYFDLSTDRGGDVRNEMSMALAAFGIQVEASHHEVASGQHEIDFRYTDALRAADNVVTFKATLKEVARRHGLHATFMPKPIAGINGSGMHVHQSLVHEDSDVNAFADASAEHGLSDLALSFVAGQLAHARGMAAVLAPLVNSYKRLVPGFEAPVYVSWGQTNRSALIRVPQIQPGRLESTRLELRCPDPSCNPYLAFAVMLRAGLDGIQRNLEAPPISNQDLYEDLSEGNLETLPGSLGQALQELQRDELVCETLGPHILDRYVEAKATEWRDYISHVSNWELERYLPIY
jgi:glutamine synthetase